MKNIKAYILSLLYLGTIATSCHYLDVVPDNVATIQNAFTSRARAERYLFTCYSYMPRSGDLEQMAFLAGDEFWIPYPQHQIVFYSPVFEIIARGNQNIVSPSQNYWDGDTSADALFTAIRDCNTFFENINSVPGMTDMEKHKWIAEVKFLKAYYHYFLFRMYGPIPIIRENLPTSATLDKIQVKREHVDVCTDYIVSLLDEATPDLPLKIQERITELGRVTQPMALALKAKVLVEAASPLFNGNPDYAGFRNVDGSELFDSEYKVEKWRRAALACKNAIDTCHLAGNALFEFVPSVGDAPLSPEMITQMSVRNAVTERWNSEIVWGDPNSATGVSLVEPAGLLQNNSIPFLDPSKPNNGGIHSLLAPPLKVAEMFYTENGVPIDEDEEWTTSGQYEDRYSVRTAGEEDKLNIQLGANTATLNFDREPRFYANLAFDKGLWYGNGKFNENDQWVIMGKATEVAGKRMISNYSVTGYYCKKLPHWQGILQPGDGAAFTTENYPFPTMRLSDLYLLYAEALNESAEGSASSPDAFEWIDRVRERAGLKPVKESWSTYAIASAKNKPDTKEGLREIIQRERLIELANEGHRYWDIRRWKLARETWNNQPIQGWDVEGTDEQTYYRVRTIFTQQFSTRDYFWPIRESNFSVNPNLVQNPGW